jgi:glutaredoxin
MKVTIYTIPNCPFSKQAKDYLTSKAIQFEEKDVQGDRDHLAEMLTLSQNFAGVPFTVIEKDSGEKVMLRGFTQSEFEAALETLGAVDMTTAQPADVAPSVPPLTMDALNTGMSSSSPVTPPADMKTDMLSGQTPVPTPVDDIKQVQTTPVPVDATPTMPAMDVAPVSTPTPSAPTSIPATPEPMDPQDELSGLLKDLESKVGEAPAAPAASPSTAPTTPPVSPMGMNNSMPPVASAAPAPEPTTPSSQPDIPDFPKTQ